MKSLLSIVALFLFNATVLRAQDDVSQSKWQSAGITVDGNDNEWSSPLSFFDNVSGLMFTVTKDSKNIYLCFSINDKVKTNKMMIAGWSLELISTEKKRKFDAAIVFPKPADQNVNIRSDFRTAVGNYQSGLQVVKTKGFLSGNGDTPLMNNDGLNIGIGCDSADKIVYEIAIPLKQLMAEDKLQLNEQITLDITINALDKPASSTGNNAGRTNAAAGFTGAGRMGGGRMGGGRGGGNRSMAQDNNASNRSSPYEKVSFKQKIRLVNK